MSEKFHSFSQLLMISNVMFTFSYNFCKFINYDLNIRMLSDNTINSSIIDANFHMQIDTYLNKANNHKIYT